MKKNKLILFWEEKVKNPIKLERSAKSLQRQAEIDVASAQEKFELAKDSFNDSKLNAKDNPKTGFQNIVSAHKEMLIAQKKFNDSVSIYEALFEEPPRLLE